MRYLTYIKPPERILEKLEEIAVKHSFNPPKNGFHITLWSFNVSEENEDKIIRELENIEFNQFLCVTGKTEILMYDNEKSLALKVYKPGKLQKLHENIVGIAKKYDENPEKLREMYNLIGGPRYNPHITLSTNHDETPLSIKETYGRFFHAKEYYLAKKKENEWTEITKIN